MNPAAVHPLAPEQRAVGPRDLGWLIASLALVVAPHALRAPWWLTLLTLCLYGWRVYFVLNRAPHTNWEIAQAPTTAAPIPPAVPAR